ncbi:uncharacterized protein lrrc41 [Lampris incognitus]|uniref:uncharacterized protein lrrc41 n=1 Tax=Lampris incognitus TaxID=2546036 RepID=UPI0024B5D962|nr:uncharacterized protein lrrc41 [Lampris incognitus]
MHEVYAEEVLRSAATSRPKTRMTSLKRICLRALSRHVAVLDPRELLEFPTSLIKDLLPHLDVTHLDKLQPALNLKGISTYSAWVALLRDIKGPNCVADLHTEEESKQETMDALFHVIFYGFKYSYIARHISNVNITSLLLVMAKHVKHFYLRLSHFLQSFTAEQRPLLRSLEKSVRCVEIKKHIEVLKRDSQYALYILHRMLDHGEAKDIIIYNQDPVMLAWILHARGSQYGCEQFQKRSTFKSNTTTSSVGETMASPDHGTTSYKDEEDHVLLAKRPKIDFVSAEEEARNPKSPLDPEVLCQTFTSSTVPLSEDCPRGQICSLQIRECAQNMLSMLVPFLPTWLCLRSLTLQSCSIFSDLDILTLARSLKQLSETSRSSLTSLSIGVLPHAVFMETLLDACLNLRSLSVEIHTVTENHGLHKTKTDGSKGFAELPLQELTVTVPQVQTHLDSITSVLKRSPHLMSLDISGIRLCVGSSHQELLNIISVSNTCLRRLHLEDLNLASCLPEILGLLENCMLEELSFRDCRLLEKCSDKKSCLWQLVVSLKRVSSLRSLSLSQNRLAKNVPTVVELFTGPSPSAVKKLDISSNFIQPNELLELGRQLEKHRPAQRVTLDLRKNPWDQDKEVWQAALSSLCPFCNILTDGWTSRDTMADHISNM